MPLLLDWRTVLLRLFLALVASTIVGFNRGEQGHPAGLRTTVLVCLAAAGAMVQVNLLLSLAADKQSLVTLDLMRLPLGILSGMGFIGGGAILKKGDIVHGVTTAATLWFVTVMGLCFGGGQLALGGELLGLALFVLVTLKRIERRFVEDRRATLELTVGDDGPIESVLRRRLVAAGLDVFRCALEQDKTTGVRQLQIDLRWRRADQGEHTPSIVDELATSAGVLKVKWDPKV